MTTIGLTGGIGSGKSTVSAMLADHGAVIIDADQIARDLVEPGEPALDALVVEFGPTILLADGRLSRAELARLAFAEAQSTQRLNQIMHPLIKERSAALIAAAPPDAIVVYDMPLLIETGQMDAVDQVVVVDVPSDIQRQRAVQRGLDPEDVDRRMGVQVGREARLALADHVIDNSSTLAHTRVQVDRLWQSLQAQQ